MNAPYDTAILVAARTTGRSYRDQPAAARGLKILAVARTEEGRKVSSSSRGTHQDNRLEHTTQIVINTFIARLQVSGHLVDSSIHFHLKNTTIAVAGVMDSCIGRGLPTTNDVR